MKIIEVIPGKFEIIRTDESRLNEYRRLGPDQWEHRLNESWVFYRFYNDFWVFYRFYEDLEEAYQQWKKTYF